MYHFSLSVLGVVFEWLPHMSSVHGRSLILLHFHTALICRFAFSNFISLHDIEWLAKTAHSPVRQLRPQHVAYVGTVIQFNAEIVVRFDNK